MKNEIYETKIKEIGSVITYTTIKGRTKEELFDNIYMYFKSNQYCWQVKRRFEDEKIKEEYGLWIKNNSEKLFWKHASGRDFD